MTQTPVPGAKQWLSEVKKLRGWLGSDPTQHAPLVDALNELTALRLLAHAYADAVADAQDAMTQAHKLVMSHGAVGPYTPASDAGRFLTAMTHVATTMVGLGQVESGGQTAAAAFTWMEQLPLLDLAPEFAPRTSAWLLAAVAEGALASGDGAKAMAYAAAAHDRATEGDVDERQLADVTELLARCRQLGVAWAALSDADALVGSTRRVAPEPVPEPEPEPITAAPVPAAAPEPVPAAPAPEPAPEPEPVVAAPVPAPPEPEPEVAPEPVVAQVEPEVIPEPVAEPVPAAPAPVVAEPPVEEPIVAAAPEPQPTVSEPAPVAPVEPTAPVEPEPTPEPVVAHEPAATPAPPATTPEPVAAQPEPAVDPILELHRRADEALAAYRERKAAGDRAGTLAASEQVVALVRQLATSDEAHYGPTLVSALHDLAEARRRGGDWWGSRGPAKEAKQLARRLGL